MCSSVLVYVGSSVSSEIPSNQPLWSLLSCYKMYKCTVIRAPVAKVPGERQCLYKWAAMPHEGDSMLNLDYFRCLNTAQLLELLEDEERMRETVRVNSKVPNYKYTIEILHVFCICTWLTWSEGLACSYSIFRGVKWSWWRPTVGSQSRI